MSEPSRVAATTALATHPIPDEIWPQLEALLPVPEFWMSH